MRIAYIINRYPAVSHSFIRREIQALERLGVEVLRVSVRKAVDLPDRRDQEESLQTTALLQSPVGLLLDLLACLLSRPVGLLNAMARLVPLSYRAERGVWVHFVYLLEACRLARLLKRENVSHMHAHFGTNSTTLAYLTKCISGASYSFTVHGPEEFDKPRAIRLSEKIEQAAFVVAVSSFGRSQLMRWCGPEHWNKLHVVRCGLDFDTTPVSSSGANPCPLLVCVGRLCEQKGQLLLIEAMHRLQERGIKARLVLAGDGDMRPAIEQRIERLDLQSSIQITGWLDGDQVTSLLLDCRAMVLPSFAEGLPVVIMEAFAVGRPVVTTYIAGIPELVENGKSGWLVPAGSIDELADALQSVLQASVCEWEQFGKAGHRRVRQKHDVNREASRLRKLVACALTERDGPESQLRKSFAEQEPVKTRAAQVLKPIEST